LIFFNQIWINGINKQLLSGTNSGFITGVTTILNSGWLMGSKSSLSDFLRGLLNYAGGKSNEGISEHIHLGPYQYLKIMTWHHPLINRDCIGGSPDDLKRLKIIIEQKLSIASAGEVFSVGKEYAAEGDYSIKFFVMADNFVPSQIEFTE
jgi:hypothetical protein